MGTIRTSALSCLVLSSSFDGAGHERNAENEEEESQIIIAC